MFISGDLLVMSNAFICEIDNPVRTGMSIWDGVDIRLRSRRLWCIGGRSDVNRWCWWGLFSVCCRTQYFLSGLQCGLMNYPN